MSRLSPDLEQYVQQKVASGQFGSPEEFALEAMRLYRDLEARHGSIKEDIQAALDQSKKGLSDPLDMDCIKGELAEELDEQGRGK